jgi:hypothetical protein
MTQDERDLLVKNLKKFEMKVTFTKANGDVRVMHCTLKEGVMPPPKESPAARKLSPDALAVWDLEKSEWRSFRYDTITDIKFIP